MRRRSIVLMRRRLGYIRKLSRRLGWCYGYGVGPMHGWCRSLPGNPSTHPTPRHWSHLAPSHTPTHAPTLLPAAHDPSPPTQEILPNLVQLRDVFRARGSLVMWSSWSRRFEGKPHQRYPSPCCPTHVRRYIPMGTSHGHALRHAHDSA